MPLKCPFFAPPAATTPQATLAAANVAALLQGQPVYNGTDVLPWVDGPWEQLPAAAPSVVNAKDLGLPML